MLQDGQTETGRLGQAHVARNDRTEQLVGEMLLQLPGNVPGQPRSAVVHGADYAANLQVGIRTCAQPLDHAHQRRQTLQRKVLALDGHQHTFGGHQSVQREDVQARRTIQQDRLIVRRHFQQCPAHLEFPALLHFQQLDFGGRQPRGCRQQVEPGRFDPDHALRRAGTAHQEPVNGFSDVVAAHAAAGGGVGLRVEIDQQHLAVHLRKAGGQVDGRRGLAHAALAVGDRESALHESAPGSAAS